MTKQTSKTTYKGYVVKTAKICDRCGLDEAKAYLKTEHVCRRCFGLIKHGNEDIIEKIKNGDETVS